MSVNSPEEIASVLEDALREIDPSIDFRWKRMFGGAGYYADDRIFAGWRGEGKLGLKLNEEDEAALLQLPGAREGEAAHYPFIPADFLDNPQRLIPWLRKSLDYVRSLPVKKRK